MYINLHMFQDLVSIIINQHSIVQTKLTQFNIIWEGMNDIDTWIAENPDDAKNYITPQSREKNTDIYALDRCQQVGQRVDKETTSSLAICSCIHKVAQELLKLCRLPQLEELKRI
jgi:hypothetical protein